MTCLHHVPLFKFIKQFQAFNPNKKASHMRTFKRMIHNYNEFLNKKVDKKEKTDSKTST